MARAMKVAIVDDEADMRQSISQWLALSGFPGSMFGQSIQKLAQYTCFNPLLIGLYFQTIELKLFGYRVPIKTGSDFFACFRRQVFVLLGV